MKVLVYPADELGCGYHRLIWPAEELRRQGHDVTVMPPDDRQLSLQLDSVTGEVVKITHPTADVIVMQRVAHRYVAAAVRALRRKGVAVVIDVDDDLNNIHPKNPAWAALHPANEGKIDSEGNVHLQSWTHLTRACDSATTVTVSAPALIPVYGRPGACHVLYNRLHDGYFEQERVDGTTIGWPASYHSHPDDPYVMRKVMRRLVDEGARFRILGYAKGAGRAFGLEADPEQEDVAGIHEWPARLATLGIGIAPSASTVFNHSKSWLKPLEMSAVGVPWVASPIPEYERLYDQGAGVLARTPDEWYEQLTRLRTDTLWRAELSEAGRAVAELHRLRDHAWRWWEAWERAYRLQRGIKEPSRVVIG